MRKNISGFAFGAALIMAAFAVGAADARPGGGFHGGAGGRGAATSIQRPAGGNFNGSANVNRNANINSNRNINANVNRNVNIDVDNHWNGGCCGYHPVAAGVAFGAAAAITAAAIGSRVYTLPTACVTRIYGAVSYYNCGSVWYQPQYPG
jgi:hypothetical protein